jgi:hypothetical protein
MRLDASRSGRDLFLLDVLSFALMQKERTKAGEKMTANLPSPLARPLLMKEGNQGWSKPARPVKKTTRRSQTVILLYSIAMKLFRASFFLRPLTK